MPSVLSQDGDFLLVARFMCFYWFGFRSYPWWSFRWRS